MTIEWLQAAAWWGAGLVALPIAIHLLVRQRSRRVAFPTLKFLPRAQVAALRPRAIEDWPLLLVRVLIVLAAVAALAAPVFVSDARRDAWNGRVVRAIVVASDGPEQQALAAEEARSSVASAQFAAPVLADAIYEATEWLRQQRPAAREIVFVGDLRDGALAAADLQAVAPHIGVRFLPLTTDEGARRVRWRAIADSSEGAPGAYDLDVEPRLDGTAVSYAQAPDAAMPQLRILAPEADQAVADAVRRAVLRDGVVMGPDTARAITIAFEGAPLPEWERVAPASHAWMQRALEATPHVRGGEVDGRLVARTNVAIRDPRAAAIAASLVRAAFEQDTAPLEPRRIAAATLASWSRPPAGSPPDALPADEGDRRWFWAAALALLAVEQVMRRRHAV